MKRIFLTGATGFLGSYVARLLVSQDYQVVATRRKSSRLELLGDTVHLIEWHLCDILDVDGLDEIIAQCDAVIHTAAIVSYDPSKIAAMMAVNIQGTAHIVNCCLAHQKRLIHVSSIAALGRHPQLTSIDESVAWKEDETTTHYARSKYRAELEVHRGIAEGLDAVIINPSVILGAGFWDAGSSKFFSLINSGLQYSPTGSTGFVDVRDVAQHILFLLQSKICGKRFISNAENLQFQELFKSIADNMNKPRPDRKASSFQKALIWRIAKIKSLLTNTGPIITKETIQQSSLNRSYDGSEIAKEANLTYRSIKTTLVDTSHAFKQAVEEKKQYSTLQF